MAENLKFILAKVGRNNEIDEFELSLSQTETINKNMVGVKENEMVYFELYSSNMLYNPELWIQDYVIYPSESIPKNGSGYLYRWKPNERPFVNYFGHCKLTLQYCEDENVSHIISISTIIDVFAVKFKAEQAKSMLDYLEDRMDDVVRTCFSRTHWNTSAQDDGMSHARAILQAAESCLVRIEYNLPRFRHKPVSKLSPQNTLQPANQVDLITPSSLEWLTQNPEQLVLPDPLSSHTIKIRNRLLGIQEMMGERLIEDTNTYENQAIMGLMTNIMDMLQEIKSKYKQLRDAIKINTKRTDIPTNYRSFDEIRQTFGRKLYDEQIKKCDSLQKRCSFCLQFWERHLPTTEAIRYLPNLTPQFSSQPHYFEVFIQMAEWYRLGKLNIDGEKYLLSLRTLDKLYEFYCLFLLGEALQKSGWELRQSIAKRPTASAVRYDEWQISPNDEYNFSLKHKRIRLQYEPRIKLAKDSEEELVYVWEGYSRRYPYREPDFVLRFSDGQEHKYVIFDSKYMKPSGARGQLPTLTKKYIHMIAGKSGGVSPVKALFALHPKDIERSYRGVYLHSYYQKPYDIGSKYPVVPTLGTIEITPENHRLNRDGLSQRLKEIFAFMDLC